MGSIGGVMIIGHQEETLSSYKYTTKIRPYLIRPLLSNGCRL